MSALQRVRKSRRENVEGRRTYFSLGSRSQVLLGNAYLDAPRRSFAVAHEASHVWKSIKR
jgi:Zn-dependent peptidase ImmA (M78 family)